MDLFKKCPTCGCENSVSEMLCSRCMGDISGIQPQKAIAESEHTIVEISADIELLSSNGDVISVRNDDVIGREGVGSATFRRDPQQGKTVSRRHAKIILDSGRWKIQDLNSANGTYLNDSRIASGSIQELKKGDKLSFSTTSFEFRIVKM